MIFPYKNIYHRAFAARAICRSDVSDAQTCTTSRDQNTVYITPTVKDFHQKTETHVHIQCFPYLEINANRKQNEVEKQPQENRSRTSRKQTEVVGFPSPSRINIRVKAPRWNRTLLQSLGIIGAFRECPQMQLAKHSLFHI